ncbi:hypothetical protein FISHEDRAFT_76687 [Fistulina hepatica ATCC 64428]|uniref:Poly A polymerase head domain-containing protein n=1 Tax=Fistulina hepatica ATCC 64428 TaxID=1128425 RepID=A0A0D7A3B1_9AGAR|nr:hypothetical protein FISHEDRAFT_76687 [Fistulina hepatica ATCC 64428]
MPTHYVQRRVTVPPKFKIELEDVEDRICTLLDECTQQLKSEKSISTSCRIAGGWLLGQQSHDIDVALTDMMGIDFANHLAAFAQSKGVETGHISEIKANPEQSKHLATATVKIFGIDLDLVNLRSEAYAEDSRIPTMVFGTPLEDALRRDITINALFYNVHSRTVEDCTEKGLVDLRDRRIRTPLPPLQTFLDDPLRILRCLRFAVRLGFDIDPEVGDIMEQSTVRDALIAKVSRERIGEEMSKMMKVTDSASAGPNPVSAIHSIQKYKLYDAVFGITGLGEDSPLCPPADPVVAVASATVLQMLIDPNSVVTGQPPLPAVHPSLLQTLSSDPTCLSRLFMACALTPYNGLMYQDKKKKNHLVAEHVIRESLKVGTQNHYLDGIPLLLSATKLAKSTVLNDEKRFKTPSERVAIGMFLRERAIHSPLNGTHWSLSLLFSLVTELSQKFQVDSGFADVDEAISIVNTYNKFAARIEELGLTTAADARPILDGREVISALGSSKPGRWMAVILDQIMQWQLEHPAGKKDECVAWLQQQQAEGKLVIEDTNLSSEPKAKRTRAK